MTDHAAPRYFDSATFMRLLGGDVRLAYDLASMFVHQIEGTWVDIMSSYGEKNSAVLIARLHAVRGSLYLFGSDELPLELEQLEADIHARRAPPDIEKLNEIVTKLRRLADELALHFAIARTDGESAVAPSD